MVVWHNRVLGVVPYQRVWRKLARANICQQGPKVMVLNVGDVAQQIGQACLARGWKVGTAESCTGGMIAAAITDIAGSSGWFDEGLVTYANASKERLLGVPAEVLREHGAVSAQVVEAMVAGVLRRGADVAVATSGVAGPDGGTEAKPVGTVWFAWMVNGVIESCVECFEGDRAQVRAQATAYALKGLLERINFTV